MLIGKDKNGKSVHIKNSHADCEYFCPICESPLFRKMGEVRQHHFAHKSRSPQTYICDAYWAEAKSEWHINWQSLFPDENIEVLYEADGERHIADVAVGKLVVEFQHSPISAYEFNRRNAFYGKLGMKVIWVFDFISYVANGEIKDGKRLNEWRWKRPKQPFDGIGSWSNNVAIFYQFEPAWDTKTVVISRIKNCYRNFEIFYDDSKLSYSQSEFKDMVLRRPDECFPHYASATEEHHEETSLVGERIEALWRPEYMNMVVTNMRTGKDLFISGFHGEIGRDRPNGKIRGKFSWKDSGNRFRYSEKMYCISDADEKIWKLKCSKLREGFSHASIDGCKTLNEIFSENIMKSSSLIVKNNEDNETYLVELFSLETFNAWGIELETGVISDGVKNAVLAELGKCKIWSLAAIA